ncbi:MAG: hypothetical protein KME29_27115 [Calothrix sp. FI2-JRJ7]|jgi:hypothetical protein|nr:hypothetical protein [Calothrix sp. FI2-JRJ7]
MKAYEFPTQLTAEGKIELPDKILHRLSQNQQLKVIIMVNEDSESDEAWKSLASEQLLKGYSEEDAIYDTIDNTI